MTALEFGKGWRSRSGRQRSLVWLSDIGTVVWDDGYDLAIIRRGMWDEISVRSRLLGWEHMVDDPGGPDWVIDRLCYWSPPPLPSPDCLVCQGEGWIAGPEGVAVRCRCGTDAP